MRKNFTTINLELLFCTNMHFKIYFLLFTILFSCSCKKEQENSINIVMLGHSLVGGVNWNRCLGRNDILNKGTGGQDIFHFYNRLQNDVVAHNPKVCFLLLGYEGQEEMIQDSSLSTIIKIADVLSDNNIILVIQSAILYSSLNPDYIQNNQNLINYNQHVKEWVDSQNLNTLFFLELNNLFAPEGIRYEHYTQDGIHLNDLGNEIWIGEIGKFINEHSF